MHEAALSLQYCGLPALHPLPLPSLHESVTWTLFFVQVPNVYALPPGGLVAVAVVVGFSLSMLYMLEVFTDSAFPTESL